MRHLTQTEKVNLLLNMKKQDQNLKMHDNYYYYYISSILESLSYHIDSMMVKNSELWSVRTCKSRNNKVPLPANHEYKLVLNIVYVQVVEVMYWNQTTCHGSVEEDMSVWKELAQDLYQLKHSYLRKHSTYYV